ncbi:DNA recombinase [Haloferula helveola]|uniref:DNA recombinase n=2 Tax=Haloferula helveola TaxID=490095 RepID=A0ABN6HAW8_9BACT|nr:DNA recombinase [Haloferula helveola]
MAVPAPAAIYARVSSTAQTKRGDGLRSQETRCRDFARMKGYAVIQVFTDDLSGSLIDRPGMQAMLAWLDANRARRPVVVIDDVSRLARNLDAHLRLRSAIDEAGGRLESPSIEFGEDSDSILVENLLASVSQHQQQKNAEQTRNRMRARILNGYWCFQAPVGYRYEPKPGQGKVLVRDEPEASIIAEALEGFASGRFGTQVEVKRFLESRPAYPKDLPDGSIRHQRVVELLTRPIYAGMVEAPRWKVTRRKGHHEPIISIGTFMRIQERLRIVAYTPRRKDLNEDFPLRGAVLCHSCGTPLTACWSKGNTRRYAYYLCHARKCPDRRKSIPRERIECDFVTILDRLTPTVPMVNLVSERFRKAWDERLVRCEEEREALRSDIRTARKKIGGLVERLMDSTSPSVAKACEARISELEASALAAEEKLREQGGPKVPFTEMFELALAFLSNPRKLWDSGRFDDRRTVLKLAFPKGLRFCRVEGFRTPEVAPLFKALTAICGSFGEMARPGGESLNSLFRDLADWEEQLKHREASSGNREDAA